MSVRIKVETDHDYPDVAIVRLQGRITLGEGAGALRDTIRSVLEGWNGQAPKKDMLLDMSDVSYHDSSGIGELVSGFSKTSDQGGKLKILAFQKRTDDLLRITKLYSVFEVYNDEKAALRSFSETLGMNITPAPAPHAHVTVISPEGMLSLGSDVAAIRNAIVGQGKADNVLLDLTRLSYAEPRAFHDIMWGDSSERHLSKYVPNMHIQALSPWKEGTDLSNAVRAGGFTTHHDREEALNSFGPPRPLSITRVAESYDLRGGQK